MGVGEKVGLMRWMKISLLSILSVLSTGVEKLKIFLIEKHRFPGIGWPVFCVEKGNKIKKSGKRVVNQHPK
jgi:hypothetical protein